jgi:PIN domain nuclease of toxin-antitoxin system
MIIKSSVGKLPIPTPAAEYVNGQIEKNKLTVLGIRMSHLAELESLPPIHRDPFDRMLVAQARAERMPILTADPALQRYDVKIL